uniref:Uncharacterized protein n=1 Tax=Romanomermis culicivorax TaxID=13658 RepID=A0A915I2V3_ROMCU
MLLETEEILRICIRAIGRSIRSCFLCKIAPKCPVQNRNHRPEKRSGSNPAFVWDPTKEHPKFASIHEHRFGEYWFGGRRRPGALSYFLSFERIQEFEVQSIGYAPMSDENFAVDYCTNGFKSSKLPCKSPQTVICLDKDVDACTTVDTVFSTRRALCSKVNKYLACKSLKKKLKYRKYRVDEVESFTA